MAKSWLEFVRYGATLCGSLKVRRPLCACLQMVSVEGSAASDAAAAADGREIANNAHHPARPPFILV